MKQPPLRWRYTKIFYLYYYFEFLETLRDLLSVSTIPKMESLRIMYYYMNRVLRVTNL